VIVCHCNVISERDIEEAIRGLLEADSWVYLTPGAVMHALSKRGKCCSCFPNLISIMISTVEKLRVAEARESAALPVYADWAETTLCRLRRLNERRAARQRAAHNKAVSASRPSATTRRAG